MNGGSFTIAPAAPADVPDLLRMIRALAEYERLTHLCTGSAADLARALFGDPPAAEVLVAEVDGAIEGFALHFPTFSTFLAKRGLWLEDLYVRPAFRGKGLGGRLLRAVAAVAVERGCGRFEWSVLDWNADAIGFYRSLGARPQDEWTVYRVTGDALTQLASGEEQADGSA